MLGKTVSENKYKWDHLLPSPCTLEYIVHITISTSKKNKFTQINMGSQFANKTNFKKK